jgi:NitT/TauT family transport system substrate-binding protein
MPGPPAHLAFSRRPGRPAVGRARSVVRRSWWLLVLAIALLPGCHRDSAALGTVRIGYFANLTHAQAVLGVASGDFAQAIAPIKLETKVFNAGPSLIEALFAGEIDIGYVGPGPVISAYEKSGGKGIRVISGAASNGVVIVARSGSGIVTLSDLAGKRVGTPQLGNTQDISARHYLSAVLKQTDLSNVVPVDNAEQSAMFSRGQLDAAWVPEPWGQRLIAEAGAKLIAEEKDLWPSKEFVLTEVVTTPEFLEKHRDVVERLLGVHRLWTQRLRDDPSKYTGQLGDTLFALTGKKLAPGILSAALAHVGFVTDPSVETLRAFAHWKTDLGFGSGPPVALDGLVEPMALEHASAVP